MVMMKDLDEQLPTFKENLNYWLIGNSNAVVFCLDMIKAIHLWDDLIDKDNELKDEEINDVFTFLMVDMPMNPFYAVNQREIAPMMQNIILKWHTANVFEKEKEVNDVDKAYMLRAELYQLFVLCATLIGGRQWGRDMSISIWRLYGESVKELKKEVQDA
jgi:hypothetical protein